MKYSLEAMDFDVNEARAALRDRTRLEWAFLWYREPEETGSFRGDYWREARDGRVPADDWHPKVKAMIAQWEAENGEGDGSAVTVDMSLRDYFAGQALANPAICTGEANEYQLRAWFGDRCGTTRGEIVSAQAGEYADAMMAEREKGGE